MSLLRTLDRTTCVTVVSNVVSLPVCEFLYPALYKAAPSRASRRPFHHSVPRDIPQLPSSSPLKSMDNIFISALVQAGSCKQHAKHLSTFQSVVPHTFNHHKTRRKSTVHEGKKEPNAEAVTRRPFKPLKKLSVVAKAELKAMVDYYGIEPLDDEPRKSVPDEGLLQWNVGNEHQPWPVQDPTQNEYIERLEELLKDDLATHEEIYATYKLLPAPGVVYLHIDTIRDLLHHLAIVEERNQASMHRYLSILDDMKTAHIHITSGEWTSAIAFAGKFMRQVSSDEIESALYIWKEMETRAGIKGTHVTFSVLFDVAVKAGKYSLAEMFLNEMNVRNLKFHRHFRISLIYYWGVRRNGNAVRQAYQDLVEQGDIIDTVVMNAVIAALFRAGEPAAAEHVFHRMKRLNSAKTNPCPPPADWREARKLSIRLTKGGMKYRAQKDTQERAALQELAPIAPDSHTYGLVIRHYAESAGNIDQVMMLLQEMKNNSIPLHGTIFIVIFHGFASFGGVRYSSWTRYHLERFWAEYLKLVQSGLAKMYFSPLAVVAGLKAWRKCADEGETLRAWEEIRGLWDMNAEDEERVLRVLNRLCPRTGMQTSYFRGNLDG
ncbi:hypothetical protein GQ43DRAFT_465888 [Delitschia confertaspora ATCC 74209]|uniref:Pentatricopeptide repeat domain protein n=1 Tax=Delitschia confertaspora ATCC 74209 TaxID=1513339 RepID=A0A9P4JEU6_9PLEO|nr:hypothetical protein GQ43DRAFT_465888 [Delitschia confertaspora ATCC 74209]